MRAWTVAGGLLEDGERILLVQNRRRDGSVDWTTPGGVIDPGESLVEGLTREVAEETGLVVDAWSDPLWTVEVDAPDMAWSLRVEVRRAAGFSGALTVDDPDGIVVDASWLDVGACAVHLASSWTPAREPMLDYLHRMGDFPRSYRYRLLGSSRSSSSITRLA